MTSKEIEIQLALGTLPLSNGAIEKLARNERTSKRILTILSTNKSWNVKCCVAMNLNTPKGVLKKLSTDEDKYVRYWVAKNPNTPIDILKELSKDKDSYVRCSARKVKSN